MPGQLMTLARRTDENGHEHLIVTGECDASNAEDLRDAVMTLIDGGADRLHIDFSATTYMDSHGILVLAEAVRRLGPGRLAVTVGEPLDRLLRITRLDAVVELRAVGAQRAGSPRGPAAHDGGDGPREDGGLRR